MGSIFYFFCDSVPIFYQFTHCEFLSHYLGAFFNLLECLPRPNLIEIDTESGHGKSKESFVGYNNLSLVEGIENVNHKITEINLLMCLQSTLQFFCNKSYIIISTIILFTHFFGPLPLTGLSR